MFICIAGKNDIAVSILQYLIDNNNGRYKIGIVCNKNEIGKDTWQKSLRAFAQKNHIQEYVLEEIYPMENLLFLSLEFDRLVKPEKFYDARLYNIHFSLLPKYRGMYTSALPILHGECETGVTLHKIDAGIDTGEIIAQQRIQIDNKDTARDLYFKYIYYGTQLVLDYVEMLINGNEKSVPQKESEASYYSKSEIGYTNICINLNKRAYEIQNQIRAFVFREYQIPEIYQRSILDTKITNKCSNAKCGEIIFENDCAMIISTLDYNLILYKDRFDELMTSCREGDIKRVQEITVVKKHIFQKDAEGNTPLIIAAKNNCLEIVQHLLLQGVDIDEKNYAGKCAVDYANEHFLYTGDKRIQTLLCDLGANN